VKGIIYPTLVTYKQNHKLLHIFSVSNFFYINFNLCNGSVHCSERQIFNYLIRLYLCKLEAKVFLSFRLFNGLFSMNRFESY